MPLHLRSEGFDASAVAEVGLSGKPDEEVLRYAVENGCVLVTLDADFANVLRFLLRALSELCGEGPPSN